MFTLSKLAVAPGWCPVCLTEIIQGACLCGTWNEIRHGQRERPGSYVEGEWKWSDSSPENSGKPVLALPAVSIPDSAVPSASLTTGLSSESAASQNAEKSTKEQTAPVVSAHVGPLEAYRRRVKAHVMARMAGRAPNVATVIPVLSSKARDNGHLLSCTCKDCARLALQEFRAIERQGT